MTDDTDRAAAEVEGQLTFADVGAELTGAEPDESNGSAGGTDGQLAFAGFEMAGPDTDRTELASPATEGGLWRRAGWVVAALVVIGLAMRLADLGGRPFHHDEGLDAWFSWRYLNGTYDGYDPVYHGPLRFYITAGFFWLFGESDTTARLLAALSGAVVVFLPWLWRRDLGRAGTIGAVGLAAISPSMLYFSRVGREDSFFLALSFGAVIVLVALIRRPRVWHPAALLMLLVAAWAVKESVFLLIFVFGSFGMVLLAQQLATASGDDRAPVSARVVRNVQRSTLVFGLALMILTLWWVGLDPQRSVDPVTGEETGLNPAFTRLGAYGIVLAGLIAGGYLLARSRGARGRDVPVLRNAARPGVIGWLAAIAGAVVTFVLWFTQFLQDWEGPVQPAPAAGEEDTRSAPYSALGNGLLAGLRYWLGEQDTVRGDSRWQYYLVVIPAYEWLILLLALVGIASVLRRPTLVGQLLVWWAVASLALHSWAGERMPWLIIHILLPYVVLAGLGCQLLWDRRRALWAPPVALALGAGLTWTVVASFQAAYERGGEPQELFVQAGQATPEVPEWTERLERLDRIVYAELGRHLTVSIDADVYWPYGWYLRDFPTGTYADLNNESDPPDSDVIFLPHWEQGELGARLEGYVALPYEHRWWWVPDFDASVGQWASWLWDRDPWERPGTEEIDGVLVEGDASDCPGSLVGQVYVRAEIHDLERAYFGGSVPEGAPTPDYEGDCRRPEHQAS